MTLLARAQTACAIAFIAGAAILTTAASAQQFGTADQAKAMLTKTVSALKADKAKTLDLINKGEGGFLDRDLYPFCFNLSDGKTVALANNNAKQLLGTDVRTNKDLPAICLARNSTPRRRSQKVKSLRSATCFQGRVPTRRRF